MNVALDLTALVSPDQYRGIGVYTKVLADNLAGFDKKNNYTLMSGDLKASNYDILLMPYFSPFSLQLLKTNPGKVILTIHDLIPIKYPEKFPRGIKAELFWRLNLHLLKKVRLVITDSEVSKNDIMRFTGLNKDKIKVIYPAVTDNYRILPKNSLSIVRKKYRLPDRFILYVGDCNWNKNVLTLVIASLKLKANLVLVGKVFTDTNIDFNHPWNQSIKEVNEITKGCNNIIKLGFVPSEDLVKIYNLANVYVQPSFDEGFGYSVIEAMKCGCPVISSYGGSLKEVSDEAAIYFNPQITDQLSKLIIKLEKDPRLRTLLVQKGLKRSRLFSLNKLLSDITNVYQ